MILKRTDPIFSPKQSPLQRGFTQNSSSINAALLVTEAQNEAADYKEDLHLVTLDAAKAFDVVWQDSLMRKIYNAGVDGSLWLATAHLYKDAETSVKWASHISEPYKVRQGVRQGGVLSAQHYKLYNNDLLHMMESLGTGAMIGHINCSAPTCCDDLAALAKTRLALQIMLDIVEYYKNRQRYGIQTTKSSNLPLHLCIESKKSSNDSIVTLDGEEIPNVTETIHLGIDRNLGSQTDIKKKVQLGRRAMYSLMGAGAYGNSGLNPQVSIHMWKTFALPRMLYGLEISRLRNSDTMQLEALQRSILRRIQCLPNNTANVAVYCLLGVRPIEQEIDLKKLSFLVSILYNDSSIEAALAKRQMAVKDSSSNSWFIHCNQILHKYKLPNIYNLKHSTKSKDALKEKIKHKVDNYVHQSWVEEGNSKSTLAYLNLHDCFVGKVHSCWKSVSHNTRDVRRAIIKVKILTGTYILQYNKAKFNQYDVSPICCLCEAAEEDRIHFLLGCSRLNSVRQKYLEKIRSILCGIDVSISHQIMSNQKLLMQLLMDLSKLGVFDSHQVDISTYEELESVSRNMCFALHSKRVQLLSL